MPWDLGRQLPKQGGWEFVGNLLGVASAFFFFRNAAISVMGDVA